MHAQIHAMRDLLGGSGVKGGVILFRGTGGAARRYLESDRSTADEYYLGAGTAVAEFAVLDRDGNVTAEGVFTPEQYADWVDWRNPFTGATRGTPRLPSHGEATMPGERRHASARLGSPRFAEMVINAPKSLSIAAALHPGVSEALDRAQADAVAEIRFWLAQHSVTRVGPRGLQEVVGVHRLETVAVVHKTSRAGDPHRHIHFQIGTRVFAAGKWRGLDTAALFKQQGAVRALGTAVIAAHPELTRVLAAHGLSLDHVTGEVAELEPYNAVLSKRAAQVEHNLAALVAAWEDAHPGEEPGPVVRARLLARAWDHQRPHKKPAPEGLGCEEGWRRELAAAGYRTGPRSHPARAPAPVGIDDLDVEELAARALDRCAASASTWTIHDIQMHVTHAITEAGITATGGDLRDLITLATNLAASDCLSVLPPTMARPEQVAHLTTISVVAAEETLRDLIGAGVEASGPAEGEVDAMAPAEAEAIERLATQRGLNADQAQAAAAIASPTPLVIVEGAAGAGKTTMLGAAIAAAEAQGRPTRIVTPTKKAADVAAEELGVPTDSVAALVHAYGWRWDNDGVWHRLKPGESDPVSGEVFAGPPAPRRLRTMERIVVDEAGMLDQDTATALLIVAAETGARIALIGDRAQLPAVGRGGVLDIAADLVTASGLEIHDLTGIHRFADPTYASFTLDLRDGRRAERLFDRLQQFGLVRLHESTEAMHAALAEIARPGDAITVGTIDEATEVNAAIRQARIARGEIPEVTAAVGSDGLPVGPGDLVMTRRNDNALGVANRQTWIVQRADDDGDLWVLPAKAAGRRASKHLPAAYVAEHVHLAYASTAYGVQGATSEAAHAVLNSPTSGAFESAALDAAGIYVGLTRGREANLLHVVAADVEDAREQFACTMERDRADRGLAHAARTAREAVAGLVAPPTIDAEYVASERARLAADIDRANADAARWENALAAIAALDSEHQRNRAPYERAVASAKASEEAIRAAVHADLLEQAAHAADAIAEAADRMYAANAAARNSGRFGRRAAERAAEQRSSDLDSLTAAVAARWGTASTPGADRTRWAQHAADLATNDHPSVLEACRDMASAVDRLALIDSNHENVRADTRRHLLGNRRASDVRRRTVQLRARVQDAKHLLRKLDTLPPADAARALRTMSEPPVPGGAVRALGTSPAARKGTQSCSAPGSGEPRRLSGQAHEQSLSL
ncbi:MobF family relaxase [Nocardioides sp. DS6]|uniref:MobF family relaxase n=1 Tax=Nocardioides eburneus TaxID=3231482 RepID=A0ABV3T189_9ACTN